MQNRQHWHLQLRNYFIEKYIQVGKLWDSFPKMFQHNRNTYRSAKDNRGPMQQSGETTIFPLYTTKTNTFWQLAPPLRPHLLDFSIEIEWIGNAHTQPPLHSNASLNVVLQSGGRDRSSVLAIGRGLSRQIPPVLTIGQAINICGLITPSSENICGIPLISTQLPWEFYTYRSLS